MTRRRAVITGLGTVNPLGLNVPTYWRALLAGQSGIAPITLFDTAAFKVKFGGEVKKFDPAVAVDPRDARRSDRFTLFAIVAAAEAVRDSGLDFAKEDAFRCGCVLGSGIGGLSELEDGAKTLAERGPGRLGPFLIPKMIANAASGNISIKFGLRGPNTTVATACSSAAHAIGDSLAAIRSGQADVMVTGGSEAAITPLGLGGFIACRALSERNDAPELASRPFDKDRDGFVLSEGAGVLVLEEYEHAKARGASIYAEVCGSGNTADAYHITAPHEDGSGAAEAMRAAARDAGWNLPDVQYINAHGTSTGLGDVAETKAVKAVFGDHAKKLMISSTKSMVGHLLGASGGVEAIACALSLRYGVLHPTINLRNQDVEAGCDLDYIPNTAREVRVRKVLSNSFGFGGHNCSLALGAV
ncbi:3-oxoacyl-acp synthase : 3-oxoacyl-[acyl-carrier-protein] synthase 2 OS=uncultured Acidobacteria bacterium A2 PE=3 SV=1: ketoacyl-synt: Ketoacyl-synt_C [Gemmataceae bacterium]|jgi:3-oxoacyl-[acyl-carrier-protein] synthase II|nr:3-oxoacyl-acp synthase : 3-oxoacyl-[acyl-carrier-protein] synthase 2 OS=uncultured Acidobacteria bacterium A2 PE=3 SV=1: ketoacyl-synt: Ketoacyl-synt_C [Gemmataceae bacterium]VTU01526.1 3-oxoacyl-acp synthase : 3-oxoacyl-[acyl-carrier-protein] synthase 2 OS=uncultured Acidobacteria bacterium A2 PE=3 SV=1: ketoacyl-synt: Ketoacyl-synt_C [Gemmataceae bacterium]